MCRAAKRWDFHSPGCVPERVQVTDGGAPGVEPKPRVSECSWVTFLKATRTSIEVQTFGQVARSASCGEVIDCGDVNAHEPLPGGERGKPRPSGRGLTAVGAATRPSSTADTSAGPVRCAAIENPVPSSPSDRTDRRSDFDS